MIASIDYVKRKFAEYNERCFEGKLEPLPFRLSSARTFLGQVRFKRKPNPDGTWHYSDFIFVISNKRDYPETEVEDTILHEMIHYYDRFTKEFHDKQLKASQTHIDFDSYKDQVFQEMMKEANSKGIHVVETIEGIPFKLANSNARYVLKNVIGEDEDCTTFVNANKHRYTMRAKGSHSFVFAEFD